MTPLSKFLVVDDVAENRYLLAKTLLRKFAGSLVQECEDSTPAIAAAQQDRLSAIIVHRAVDVDGLTLIKLLRQVNPTIPIVMVSGRESCPGAIEAGATAFLNYDAWLRIGTVVEDTIRQEKGAAHPSKFPFAGMPSSNKPAASPAATPSSAKTTT
jgi:CheY-like chemotaxis protein